jgi:ABC-type transport system substrate-binding protein
MRYKLTYMIGIIVTAVLVLSPLEASGRKVAPDQDKTLHFAIFHEFYENYDPVEMNYINLQFFFHTIYSTLFKLDASLKVHPFLLETYEQKGKNIVLHLKKNLRFSDGSLITSADVTGSIEAGMRYSSFPNPIYNVVEGGEEFSQGKTPHCTGIKSLDPLTVEIRLKNENKEFTYYFTAGIMSILPHQRNQGKKIANIRSSGAFRVVESQRREAETVVTLEPNPYYIGEKSKITRLFIHFYRDQAAFTATIRKGVPDLFIYNRHLKMPQSRYKYSYFKTPIFGAFYFILNAQQGPFRDKKLRTFFKNFILGDDLMTTRKWELSTPCKIILPYSLMGYDILDPMAAGEFKSLIPAKKIKITSVNPDTETRKTLLPLLKKRLAPYNLDLQLQWEKIDNIQAQTKKRPIDLISFYYLVDVPLSSYFYETLFTPGHELNPFDYAVPKALELLEAYRKETDELKKLKILARLEMIAQDEAFVIPLFNPLSLLGYKDHVKNARIDKFLNISFEDIDVKERH